MKKSTKIIAVISALIILFSTLCACQITFGDEQTTTTTTTSTTEEASASTTSTTTTEKKIETDSLDTILNLIKDYPIATAGSTTKAVQIALSLLNFSEHSKFDINDVKRDYKNFTDGLSDSQKLTYEENFVEIDYMARKIISDPTFPSKYIADYTPSTEKYTMDNYETLCEVITE